MPFTLVEFAELRPYLYHVTAAENVRPIAQTRRLAPAAELLRRAGRLDLLAVLRREPVSLRLHQDIITIKDHGPLIEANIAFEQGCNLARYIALLNEYVFFWPGDECNTIGSGVRHRAHYGGNRSAMIRIQFASLQAANMGVAPHFTRCNSGSARIQLGRRVPRGALTFQDLDGVNWRRSQTIEVAFKGALTLPEHVDLSVNGDPWTPL